MVSPGFPVVVVAVVGFLVVVVVVVVGPRASAPAAMIQGSEKDGFQLWPQLTDYGGFAVVEGLGAERGIFAVTLELKRPAIVLGHLIIVQGSQVESRGSDHQVIFAVLADAKDRSGGDL